MMRRKINNLRENIMGSGNPAAQYLLNLLDSTQQVSTVSEANQIFMSVATQQQQYLEDYA